jgi:uncharacterized protein YbbK (DUF523 family)
MIAVSACLAGERCTHHGAHHLISEIKALVDNDRAVAVCPEVLGGLPIPRLRAEIVGGEGRDVLEGRAQLLRENGAKVTEPFVRGAQRALEVIRKRSVKTAILKSNSPSCGSGSIYDGSFRSTCKRGDGVAAALFKQNGITVLTEKQFLQRSHHGELSFL